MANKQMSEDDLFGLLDKELDDLKDLPEFKVPHTGVYRFHVTGGMKEINDKPAVVFSHVVKETIELADSSIPEEERSKPEDKFDLAFILVDNSGNKSEIAEGRMKEYLKPFAAHFGTSNVKSLLQGPLKEGVNITATCVRTVKKDRSSGEDRINAVVKDITID